MFEIVSTITYLDWFQDQNLKVQAQVSSRLDRITEFGHFGDAKHLSDRLAELRWKNGLRIYFALSVNDSGKVIILLLGGLKNTQRRDIIRAKRLLKTLVKDSYEKI